LGHRHCDGGPPGGGLQHDDDPATSEEEGSARPAPPTPPPLLVPDQLQASWLEPQHVRGTFIHVRTEEELELARRDTKSFPARLSSPCCSDAAEGGLGHCQCDGPLGGGPEHGDDLETHDMCPIPAAKSYSFTLPASKFNSTDRIIVTPNSHFDVVMRGNTHHFLVQITASKIEEAKGGHSFRKARGRGKLEVNCTTTLSSDVPPAQISVSVGSRTAAPVAHNFSKSSRCSPPCEDEGWDFRSAVDAASQVPIRVGVRWVE